MTVAPQFLSRYYERLFAVMIPNYRGDINVVQEFSGHIDDSRLQQAFLTALALEPMWSYRFITRFWTPVWRPIARDARSELFTVLSFPDDAARAAAIEQRLLTTVDAAIQVYLLRTPQNDLFWYRGDHRLADAGAVKMFVDAVTDAYQCESTPPPTDGPVVRRTISDFTQYSLADRRELLKEFLAHYKYKVAIRAFKTAAPTPAAPYVMPQLLSYPEGTTEALATRALQDRATPIMVIGAITYCVTRDLFSLAADQPVPVNFPVDLRRYLPPESRHAPASMLSGAATAFIEPQQAGDLSSVIGLIRKQLAEQRGPRFGLVQSPLSVSAPLLNRVLEWAPYWLVRRTLRRMLLNWESTPSVMITDLGNFGQAGADWDGVRLENGYCTQGKLEFPVIMVGSSTCGSRLTLSVGSGTAEFVAKFAACTDRYLSEYIGRPPLLSSNHPAGTPE